MDLTNEEVRPLFCDETTGELYKISFESEDATRLAGFLTNLIIAGNDYQVNSIGYDSLYGLTLEHLSLVLRGKNITVNPNANIIANNVIIRATDKDVNYSNTDTTLYQSTDSEENGSDMSIFDVYVPVTFTLSQNAAIKTSGSVWIATEADLTHTFIPYAAANAVSVKAGESTVNLNGSIDALSNVRAQATVKVAIDVSNSMVSDYYIPLAINIAVTNAEMNVNGTVNAGYSVKLGSVSDVKINTTAVAGKLPFSAAVSVVSASAKTNVSGTVTAGEGNLDITSNAKTAAVTKAVNKWNITDKKKQEAQKKKAAGEITDNNDKNPKEELKNNIGIGKTSIKKVTEETAVKNYGGFIATAVISQTTETNISKHAELRAEKGKLTIKAESKQDISTVASSEAPSKDNPKATTSSSKKADTSTTLKNVLTTLQSYFTDKEQEASSNDKKKIPGIPGVIDEVKKQDGAIDKADKKVDDATKQSDDTAGSRTTENQCIGAVAVSVVSDETSTVVNTDGTLKAGKGIDISARSAVKTSTKADASQVKQQQQNQTNDGTVSSLGVGIGVEILDLTNVAKVLNGTVDGSDLDLLAHTDATVKNESKAGYSFGGFGLAGAITVGVHSIKTYAYIEPEVFFTGAENKAGAISVKAESNPDIQLSAVGSAPKTGDSAGTTVGVGAAICVDVSNIEAVARLKDIRTGSNGTDNDKITIASITVSAENKGKENASASAGAKGGSGITPAISMLVSGVHAEATAGDSDEDGSISTRAYPFNVAGKVSITATNEMIRNLSADAESAGESVAAGGAISVDVINDSTESYLRRSTKITDHDLVIKSKSNIVLKSGAKAGAAGAAQKKEKKNTNDPDEDAPTADQIVDSLLDNVAALAEAFDGEPEEQESNPFPKIKPEEKKKGKNTNKDKIKDKTKDRQKAETAEGKVGVAAAVTVSILNQLNTAAVSDGIDVDVGKAYLEVKAINNFTVSVNADASATKAETGVGVAVAINVANLSNEAYIGNGSVRAWRINIWASYEYADAKIPRSSVNTESISGSGSQNVGVAGSVAIAVIDTPNKAHFDTPAEGKTTQIVYHPEGISTAAGHVSIKGEEDVQIRTVASAVSTTYTDPVTQKQTKVADANKDAVEKADSDVDKDSPQQKTEGETVSTGTNDAYNVANDPTQNNDEENANVSKTGIGASFALTIADDSAEAYLCPGRNIGKEFGAAYGAYVKTNAKVDAGTGAVAGKQDDKSAAKYAIDASVALQFLTTKVKSGIGSDSGAVELDARYLDLTATLAQNTKVQSCVYATGSKAIVGATVSLGIVDSDVSATLYGNAKSSNDALIKADALCTDHADAVASVTGASQANQKKKLTADPTGDNKTVQEIVRRLGDKASVNDTASTNVLKAGDAKTEGTADKDIKDAVEKANGEGNTDNKAPAADGSNIEIAAAVAVEITRTKCNVLVHGNVTTSSGATVWIHAENRESFRARATGAATGKNNSNDIGLAVAVATNENDAIVDITGSIGSDFLTAEKIDIKALSIINLNDKYNAAQAIACAFSGGGDKVTIDGAVAIAKAKGNTRVWIHNAGSEEGYGYSINADKVSIHADNSTKLAVRSGGISKTSKGTTVGAGAAFSLIYDDSSTETLLGDKGADGTYLADRLSISGSTVSIKAVKERIQLPDDGVDIMTILNDLVAIKGDDVISGASQSSLINIILDKNKGTVSFKFPTLNDLYETIISTAGYWLEFSNYYAEAIGGTISGKGTVAAQGSSAMVFYNSTVNTMLGNKIKINAKGTGEDDGVSVIAEDKTRARVISGSVSISKANTGVAASVGVLKDNSRTQAIVGDNATVTTNGKYVQDAIASNEYLVITVAPSIAAAGASTTANIGGCVDVIILKDIVLSEVGESSKIEAEKGISVTAERFARALLCSADVEGGSADVAVGGTVSVIVEKGSAVSRVKNGAQLIASEGDVNICAESSEKLLGILASVSGAPSGSAGVAATVGVYISESDTEALVGDDVTITGKGVNIKAAGSTYILPISVAFNIQKAGTGVRGNVLVNVFDRTVNASLGQGCNVTATATSVVILAGAYDWNLNVAFSLGIKGDGTGFAADIPATVSSNKVYATAGVANAERETLIQASDTVGILADLDSFSFTVAGDLNISYSSGKTLGAVASVIRRTDEVKSLSEDLVRIIANGQPVRVPGIKVPGEGIYNKSGIVISAKIRDKFFQTADSATAGAGSNGKAAGVTMILDNNVEARLGRAGNGATHVSKVDVTVQAEDDTHIIAIAGNAAVTAISEENTTEHFITVANIPGNTTENNTPETNGINVLGAVLVTVFDKNVKAELNGDVDVSRDVFVKANAKDELYFFSGAAAGGSRTIDGDANVVVFRDNVTAFLNGNVLNAKQVETKAETDTTLYTIGGAAAVGASAGGTGVVLVTYFEGNTKAYTGEGLKFTVRGDMTVNAVSKEEISADCAAVATGGSAQISGAIDILINNIATKAYTGNNSTFDLGGTLSVTANDDFDLFAIAASASAAGSAGVTVTGLVVLDYNTVLAEIGTDASANTTISAKDVKVNAASSRDIFSTVGTIGVGGSAGIPVSVTVLVSGAKMNQDAYDMLFAKETNGSSIAPQSWVDDAFTDIQIGSQDYRGYKSGISLSNVLQGDGQKIPKDFDEATDEDAIDQDVPGDGISKSSDAEGSPKDLSDDEINKYDNVYSSTDNIKIDPVAADGGLKDSTTAMIHGGVTINNAGVEVIAANELSMLSITGAVGVGGSVGAGVGISVAQLCSNVIAQIEEGAVINNAKDVTVKAISGQSASDEGAAKINRDNTGVDSHEEILTNINATDKSVDISTGDSRIMLIGASVAVGGTAGVSVNGGVLLLYNDVLAAMDGIVNGADSVSVLAENGYGNVLTISASLAGGGMAGVAGSVAVTNYDMDVIARIGDNAVLTGVTNVSVGTSGALKAMNISGAVGGAGTAGIAASVSLYLNRTDIQTYIGSGAKISGAEKISVTSVYASDNQLYNINGSFGFTAVGAAVTVGINDLSSLTYIGTVPGGDKTAGSGFVSCTDNITVENELTGDMTLRAAGVSGGAISMNAIVSVGNNSVRSIASAGGVPISAKDLTVISTLTGNVLNTPLSFAVGGVAANVVVAIGRQTSENRAVLDVGSGVDLTGSLTVSAGRQDRHSYSDVTVTGAAAKVGLVGGTVNVFLANNGAVNDALVAGSDSGHLNVAGDAHINAYGTAYAYAVAGSGGISAVDIGVNVVIAKITAEQNTSLKTDAPVRIGGDLFLTSRFNDTKPAEEDTWTVIFDNAKQKSARKLYTAEAYIISANANLAGIGVHTVISKADATVRTLVQVKDLTVSGKIQPDTEAVSDSYAGVMSYDESIAGVGIIVAYSYADGHFDTKIVTDGTIRANRIILSNEYTSSAISDVTPEAKGAGVSLVDGHVNISHAKVRTEADASVEGTGTVTTDDRMQLDNTGYATANAKINPTVVSVDGAVVGVNMVSAETAAVQNAYIRDIEVKAGGAVVVRSTYNRDMEKFSIWEQKEGTGAYTSIGTSTVEVDVISASPNLAKSTSNSIVSAYIETASLQTDGDVSVIAAPFDSAKTDVMSPTVAVNAAKIAVTVLEAEAHGDYRSYIDTKDGLLQAGTVTVRVCGGAGADSKIGPNGGKSVTVGGVEKNYNETTSVVTNQSTAYISGSGELTASGDISVQNEMNIRANAASTSKEETTVAISNAKVLQVTAKAAAVQDSYIDLENGLVVNCGKNLNVRSMASVTASGEVGTRGGVTLSIIDSKGQDVRAYSDTSSNAHISGTKGTVNVNGDLTVKAESASHSDADAKRPGDGAIAESASTIAQASATDRTEAYIDGATVTAENISILSDSKAESKAIGTSGHSVNIVGFTDSSVLANVGSEEDRQYSGAAVLGGSKLTARKDITVEAVNSASVEAASKEGEKIGLWENDKGYIPTYAFLETVVQIDGTLNAGGNINIDVKDSANEDATLNGDAVGLKINETKDAVSTADMVSRIDLGNGTDVTLLKADGDINVYNSPYTRMVTEALIKNKGLFDGEGKAKTSARLNREAVLNVNSGTCMEGDNIRFSMNTGDTADRLTTRVNATGEGLADTILINADTYYTSAARINVATGTEIKANNDVEIKAVINSGRIQSGCSSLDDGIIKAGTRGASSFRPSDRYNDDYSFVADVNIGRTGDGEAIVSGENINISTVMQQMDLNVLTNSVSASDIAGDANAVSAADLGICMNTEIGNADIRAKEQLTVATDADVESRTLADDPKGVNLNICAISDCVSLFEETEAKAYLKKYAGKDEVLHTEIREDAKLSASSINILVDGFNAVCNVKAFKNEQVKGAVTENDFYTTVIEEGEPVVKPTVLADTMIKDGATLCLQDLDVKETVIVSNKMDEIEVKASDRNFGGNYYMDFASNTLVFDSMRPTAGGKLVVERNQNPNGLELCRVYAHAKTTGADIVNNTNYSLKFNDVSIDGYGFPEVEFHDCASEKMPRFYPEYIETEGGCDITIRMNGYGNVDFNGVLNNPKGSLTIIWPEQYRDSGEGTRTVTTNNGIVRSGKNETALNLNGLTISGAGAAGNGKSGPISVKMSDATYTDASGNRITKVPQINIQADRTVFLDITTAEGTNGVTVGTVKAINVTIRSAGDLYAAQLAKGYNITAANLELLVTGSIATPSEYMHVYVPGNLITVAGTGRIYLINHYRPDPKPDPKPIPHPTSLGYDTSAHKLWYWDGEFWHQLRPVSGLKDKGIVLTWFHDETTGLWYYVITGLDRIDGCWIYYLGNWYMLQRTDLAENGAMFAADRWLLGDFTDESRGILYLEQVLVEGQVQNEAA